MRGGDLKVLQEILGHKTIEMTMKYAHLSQVHKRDAMNLMNGLTTVKKLMVTITKTEKLAVS
jgi:integrase